MEKLTWLAGHYWVIYGAGCGLMVVLMLIRVLTNRRARVRSTSHGSSRWALTKEIRRAGLFAEDGVMLGRIPGTLPAG